MRRWSVLVMLVACGSHPAAPRPMHDAPVTNQVEARPVQQPLPPPDAPTQYILEHGDRIAELLAPAPVGWNDQSDWERTVELVSPAGSKIHIELGDDGALACTHEIAKADLAFADAIEGYCATLTPDPIRDDLLEWRIDLTPATVKLADITKVEIGFTVTNKTDAVIDAHHDPLTVAIDGKTSTDVDMAFGNGGYSSDWEALPPGKSEHDARAGLTWVTSAGDHEVTLLRVDRVIARATLHVKP